MEIGILDGVEISLLNEEGRKDIFLDESRSRFILSVRKAFRIRRRPAYAGQRLAAQNFSRGSANVFHLKS